MAVVESALSLEAILIPGVRRILARRPGHAAVEIETICDASVSTGQAARILNFVREAVLNSVDYSHPSGVLGRILLSCIRQQDGSIKIQVTDDGTGLPEGFDTASDGGAGFRMMRRISAELGAVLGIESSCLGLEVSLTLPPPFGSARAR